MTDSVVRAVMMGLNTSACGPLLYKQRVPVGRWCHTCACATNCPLVPLQGWVPVDVLAQHMRSKPSLEELRQVVTENDKVGYGRVKHAAAVLLLTWHR
jgi:hypothetical protein